MKTLVVRTSISENSVTNEMIDAYLNGRAHTNVDATGIANNANDSTYVNQLLEADEILIGAPLYNFGMSASLKAWLDKVIVAGTTFKYVDGKPMGLLSNKKVRVFFASGGVEFRSSYDFLTPHLDVALGFVGLTDVNYHVADQLVFNPDKKNVVINAIKELTV